MSNQLFLSNYRINGKLVRAPRLSEALVENILHTNHDLLQAVSRASTSMDSVMTQTERLIEQYDQLLWDKTSDLPSDVKEEFGTLLIFTRHCAQQVFNLIAEITKIPTTSDSN